MKSGKGCALPLAAGIYKACNLRTGFPCGVSYFSASSAFVMAFFLDW